MFISLWSILRNPMWKSCIVDIQGVVTGLKNVVIQNLIRYKMKLNPIIFIFQQELRRIRLYFVVWNIWGQIFRQTRLFLYFVLDVRGKLEWSIKDSSLKKSYHYSSFVWRQFTDQSDVKNKSKDTVFPYSTKKVLFDEGFVFRCFKRRSTDNNSLFSGIPAEKWNFSD